MESTQLALLSLITGRDAAAGASPPDPATLIVGDARASAQQRLEVYAHMYRARMIEALESQFPRLAAQLGPDAFADLCAAYVADEPSTHPSLRRVGERLPAWLAAHRPDDTAAAPLARLEWARADVFDAADEPVLTLDQLRAWPANRFAELPLLLIAAHRLTRDARLVWRQGTTIYHRTVDDAERAALLLVSEGTRFGVVCESLLLAPDQNEPDAVARAFTWLSTWVTDGLLVDGHIGVATPR
jgi:hypothetical protein